MRGGKRPLPGVGGVPTDLITGSKCTLLRTSGSRELGRVDVTGSRSLQALPGRALLPAPSTRVSWSCIYPDFPEVPPTLGDCEQVACGGRLGVTRAYGVTVPRKDAKRMIGNPRIPPVICTTLRARLLSCLGLSYLCPPRLTHFVGIKKRLPPRLQVQKDISG